MPLFENCLFVSIDENIYIYLVENRSYPINYSKVSIDAGEEGAFNIKMAVKNDLWIKGDFKLYDQNG